MRDLSLLKIPTWDIWLAAGFSFLAPYLVYRLFHWLGTNEQFMKRWKSLKSKPKASAQPTLCSQLRQPPEKTEDEAMLHRSLNQNVDAICKQIGDNTDLYLRPFQFGQHMNAMLLYMDCATDKQLLDEFVLKPLMRLSSDGVTDRMDPNRFVRRLRLEWIPMSELEDTASLTRSISAMLVGSAVLLVDGSDHAILIGAKTKLLRAIDEPSTEALVRGPRLGFIESLRANTVILRDRTNDPNFKVIGFELGQRNRKKVSLFYVQDIAQPELVEEVKRRISQIDVDDLPESGYIEQLIEDNYMSPFPQLQTTERPDRVIAGLLEGRVAIMLDGSPFALIAPVTFNMLLQTPEDYYTRWIPGSLLRVLRYVSAFVSLFGPALYIAFISFHQGLIPTKLAISMSGTREGVPFPPLVEALMMEIAIEILREAGLRLPKPVGQAVGLVGGLVIGTAAVEAHLVSPLMVIVVALTAITSFAIPQYEAGVAIRMLRFIVMFCAATLGLYGIILFILMLLTHVVKLKSFGLPYVSPAVPFRSNDWQDFLLRLPLFKLVLRPRMLKPQDQQRETDIAKKGGDRDGSGRQSQS
ncbi:spore germination protein [Paenibacillus sp. MER TA 81-3]|uniref:spore germination protein n=1 Tax=Paenibacillus sp. MER TA 81-3 TaxID=2939573 RepID=UPI00203F2AB0|nr:spore germination protein [Paenibacillus sp. MER TA 81-3]MCM3342146.1 spore germination protein [Paenibacillus sp. MER TA 81-3]